jgi:hypothetical protein
MWPRGRVNVDFPFGRGLVDVFVATRNHRHDVLHDQEENAHADRQVQIVRRLKHDAEQGECFCHRVIEQISAKDLDVVSYVSAAKVSHVRHHRSETFVEGLIAKKDRRNHIPLLS